MAVLLPEEAGVLVAVARKFRYSVMVLYPSLIRRLVTKGVSTDEPVPIRIPFVSLAWASGRPDLARGDLSPCGR